MSNWRSRRPRRRTLSMLSWRKHSALTIAFVAVATLSSVALLEASSNTSASAMPACTAEGNSLQQAITNYNNKCSQPRKDCDPIGGGRWMCSSESIGGGGGTTTTQSNNNTTTTQGSGNGGVCSATGNTRQAAENNFRNQCPGETLVDCDPAAGVGFRCANVRLNNGELPGNNTTTTQNNNNGGKLGRFDRDKDLLLCNFDSKPDEDDLHAVAGLGTMLADSRFNGVDYHCIAGAYGNQNGKFLNEPRLFNLAFGNSNWTNADANRNNAVNVATNKAIAALDRGGDVWVAEAGQSEVTAAIVRKIKNQRSGVNTKQRVHVVQHNIKFNEGKTKPSDLSFVKNNTDYRNIGDGNGAGNGTPNLTTNSGQFWSRAKNDAQVGELWKEADAAARRGFCCDWDNPKIKGGGMDFSDTVEPMWIFGFEGRGGGVKGFFDEFL